MIGEHTDQDRINSSKRGRFTVLDLDRLSLLVPQHQVQALEPAFDVQFSGTGVGWISVSGTRSPVYCLSNDLQTTRAVPTDYPICVLLNADDNRFGLLCKQVQMVEESEADISPLPECMRTAENPLWGLLQQGEKVLCATSAHDLLACLDEKPEPAPTSDSRSMRF